MKVCDDEAMRTMVRAQAKEIFRSLGQLAKRVRRAEKRLGRLDGECAGVEWSEDEARASNNERSYLRAELEMSREMHARLEGVFDRLLALLDAREAETYTRMHLASSKL